MKNRPAFTKDIKTKKEKKRLACALILLNFKILFSFSKEEMKHYYCFLLRK